MIPKEADLGTMVRVEFPMPNNIPFMHDRYFGRGLPCKDWWIGDFNGEWVDLIRAGYGTRENYGSGSVSIAITQLSRTAADRAAKERTAKEDLILHEAAEIARRRGVSAS